jgi:hypothetical protein
MAKRAELMAVWSKRHNDMVIYQDDPANGVLLSKVLTFGVGFPVQKEGEKQPTGPEMWRRFRAELESRGFDPDTFTVSVRRKKA